jgi:hypothetical protein
MKTGKKPTQWGRAVFNNVFALFLTVTTAFWGVSVYAQDEALGVFEKKTLRAMEVQPTLRETQSIFGTDRARAAQLIWDGLEQKGPLGQFSLNDGLALRLLLKLEDHRAIQFVVNKMVAEYEAWSFSGAEICWKAGQLQVLPYLAPLLFINEPSTYPAELDASTSWPERRRSVFATLTIANIIEESEEAPKAVREWAGGCDLTDESLRDSAREKMRAWWKANEAAIRAHDYARLVPGSPFERGDIIVLPGVNGRSLSAPQESGIAAATQSKEHPTELPNKTAPSSDPSPRQNATNWFFAIAGIALALLVGATVLLRAMRTKT